MEPVIRENPRLIKKITTLSVKSFLFVVIFTISFFLSAISFPESWTFISDSLPQGNMNFKLQNRLAVILFFFILLLFTKKKYLSYFSLEPFKRIVTYFWIIGLLTVAFLINSEATFSVRELPLSGWQFIQLTMILCVITPIEEEFMYRGLLLLVPYKKWRYVMLTFSVLAFAFIHTNVMNAFWLGLILGILALRFRNILVPIFAHAVWNLFAAYFVF
jgi:membrane protease YdiL (CAAX protease family)